MATQQPTFLGEPLTGSGNAFYDEDRVVVYWSRPLNAWVARCTIPGLATRTTALSMSTALYKLERYVVDQFRAMGESLGYEVE